MLIPEELRKGLPKPPSWIRNVVKDANSPLMLQRSSDLYVVVVRLPDRPHLRLSGEKVQLIPGENHWETHGYHVFKDGQRITNDPLRLGASLELPGKGSYTTVAVEWSGLESKPSLPLKIQGRAAMEILSDKPSDFSWIRDRYLVQGKEVSQEDALRSQEAVAETVHLHDGVIQRTWYRQGKVIERHDFNLEGKAIRRLFYQEGTLAPLETLQAEKQCKEFRFLTGLVRREYHDRNGNHVSTELFSPDGHITESIQHGSRPTHWWYEHGVPVKYARGSQTYVADGTRWVQGK
jgi:hypothetical protein